LKIISQVSECISLKWLSMCWLTGTVPSVVSILPELTCNARACEQTLAQEGWIQMQNIWSHFLLQLLLHLDADKVHLAKYYLLPEYG
jgi:hypothetical protein